MSERFGTVLGALVHESGAQNLTALLRANGLPLSAARWLRGEGEPRNGRSDAGLLRILDALKIKPEDRPAALDRLFGEGKGYVGGRARAARARRTSPPASTAPRVEPQAKVTDIRDFLETVRAEPSHERRTALLDGAIAMLGPASSRTGAA